MIRLQGFDVKYKKDLKYSTLEELLKSDYENIYNDLNNDYIIEYQDFDIFHEITFRGDVVGFFTLKILEEKRLSLEEAYIKPEFRGKNLVYREILNLLSIPNVYLYVRRPNFAFIKMLQKHNIVENIIGNIFGLGIETIVDSDDIYVNEDIDFLYDLSSPFTNFYSDYVYDMDSKLLFIQDMWGNVSKKNGMIAIVTPRKSDLEKYNYSGVFEKFTIFYIDDISYNLFDKNSQIENCWGLIERELSNRADANKIIGFKPPRSIKNLLSQFDLDKSVAFDIKNHLSEANDKAQLKDKYNKFRINYLVRNPDKIKKTVSADDFHFKGICPLCGHEYEHFENCDICGFDFENIDYWE